MQADDHNPQSVKIANPSRFHETVRECFSLLRVPEKWIQSVRPWHLCCDAIVTDDDKILFTEINVRPGAETHAYVLAQHLFGVSYKNKMIVLTRNGLKTDSFIKTCQQLEDENLLLNNENNTGIVLLTVDDTDSKQFEFLIAAPDSESALALDRN